MNNAYSDQELARATLDAFVGHLVLEFGSNTCGICQAALPLITEALSAHPGLQHVKIQDGRGRALGRSFGVKLWPTLVFLRDGKEVARVVRPGNVETISTALAMLGAG